jgi:hypothetical protein
LQQEHRGSPRNNFLGPRIVGVGKNGPGGVRLAVKIQLSYIRAKLGLKSFGEFKCIYAEMGQFRCIIL